MLFIIISNLEFPLINGDELQDISQMLKTQAKVLSTFVCFRMQVQMQDCMLFKYLCKNFILCQQKARYVKYYKAFQSYRSHKCKILYRSFLEQRNLKQRILDRLLSLFSTTIFNVIEYPLLKNLRCNPLNLQRFRQKLDLLQFPTVVSYSLSIFTELYCFKQFISLTSFAHVFFFSFFNYLEHTSTKLKNRNRKMEMLFFYSAVLIYSAARKCLKLRKSHLCQ